MADRAHAHDRVPGLDMRLAVPGERRDPLPEPDAEAGEDRRDGERPRLQIGIADPGDAAALAGGDHLGMRVPLGGVVQELVQGQPKVLHASVDHRQPVALFSSGEITPVFQFHGWSPAARRRHIAAS